MRDIGREMGISAVTVSKAMSGKPGVSEKLREQILIKAGEMGYVFPAGKAAEAGRSLDIGILIPDRYFEPESYYALLYKKLVQALADLGHFGLLEILKAEDEAALNLPNLIRSGRADGIILLGEPGKEYYRKTARAGKPAVFLDFYDERGNADSVIGDNVYGAYRLTSHLIRQGHKRIGFVGNVRATSSIMDRYLGYCRAMLAHGYPMKNEWVLNDRPDTGLMKMKDMQDLPEDMPTAFVCNCDLTARTFIGKLREAGYRVPGDISVTGFDDYPPEGEGDIPLSTFRIDTDTMIRMAVKAIVARCNGSREPFGRMVVGGQPVYRETETRAGRQESPEEQK
jgi:LacI family transcriptional regulator